MSFILFLLFAPGARALDAPSLILPRAVEVRAAPELAKPAVLQLDPGTEVFVTGRAGEFTRVRLRTRGAWKRGFVWTTDLEQTLAPGAGEADAARTWGFGVVGTYTLMRQAARSFQTEDQVTWTTSAFSSLYAWPSVYVQYGRRDFWRLALGARPVAFTGVASAQVGINNARAVEVDQLMYSGRVDKAFTLWRALYVSVGGEIARATTLTETLGGIRVPTGPSDVNVYAGLGAGLGADFIVSDRWSIFIEERFSYYPSVKPAATASDASLGVSFWL